MSHIPFAKVPIIHQGLRQEETIVQITFALDYLETVSNCIFQHIKTSVSSQTAHLSKLKHRANVAQAKIEKLSGTNKATKVFASAKYPGSEIFKDHKCDLLSNPLAPIDYRKVKMSSKHLLYDPDVLKDKTQHFHIKTTNKQIRKNIEVTPEEGLGSLPNDLDSISSLLLFNTSENLYKKYVMLDPLGIVTKTREILQEEVKGDLDAAPKSMCQETVDFKGIESYFYSPTMQEIPQLDVPLDLPDLPGIAGDLQFSMDSGPPIAPSSCTPIPDLPNIFSEGVLPSPPPPPPPIIVSCTLVDVPLKPAEPLPPPPPSQIPPPPPPLPPADPLSGQEQSSFVASSQEQPNVPKVMPNDARANLMEAIRNAGGKGKAKLRSVVDRKQEAKRMKQEEDVIQASPGGNLMADLHAKLSLRRKGISGSQPGSDPLERVLAMMPPPPAKESDTEDQEDADWEA